VGEMMENDEFLEGVFDVVVLGTGLSEAILAGYGY
jgi:RAB protein geranylgeranyltransferase component A